MKTTTRHLRVVALFFSVLILLQSCTVYQSASVTLDEASKTNNKVRVEKRNGEKVKYSKIVLLNDRRFYGVEKVNGLFSNILIDEDEVEIVKLKNETLSTIITVVFPLVLFTGIIALILYGDMIGGYSDGFH